MFDFGIGYTEIVVIAIIAVIVIGPKDLPKVLRALGQTLRKVRGMAGEFQGHLDQAMREAGVDDIKKDLQGLKGGMEPPGAKSPAPIKTAAQKAEDEFKSLFGEGEGKTSEPTKPA